MKATFLSKTRTFTKLKIRNYSPD